MSNTSSWNYSASDGRYIDKRTDAYYQDDPNHPFSIQEVPRSRKHDSALTSFASDTRSSIRAIPWDRDADHRHSIASGGSGPMIQHRVQEISIQSRPEYVDRSSYVSSRDNCGSISSQYSTGSTNTLNPIYSDNSSAIYDSGVTTPKKQQHHATPGIPMGFDRLLNHSPIPSPPPRRPSTSSHYHLHIRQQPSAARACGPSDRGRRPVDPPPIIQMLLTDFDLHKHKDVLQDPQFTVGCLLFPLTQSGVPELEEGGANQGYRSDVHNSDLSTPLLSGKTFISPFFVDADPDPATAPVHPTTEEYTSVSRQGFEPAAFFIFPDLSISKPGLYQLQFRLMNWGSISDTGQSMPILAEVWSQPFRVHAAKNFPGMSDSSPLTEGLRELGFVELTIRGNGRGKGRRSNRQEV